MIQLVYLTTHAYIHKLKPLILELMIYSLNPSNMILFYFVAVNIYIYVVISQYFNHLFTLGLIVVYIILISFDNFRQLDAVCGGTLTPQL